MPEIKWTSLSEGNPKSEYLAFAEMGERKSVWSFFSFLMRARKVQAQLKTAKGLIGYTAKLGFANREIVMVAVFENQNALDEFAHTGQHANCMSITKDDLKGGMKYAKWNISGADLPPKLEDAINRIKNK
jgi:hypothetical protein